MPTSISAGSRRGSRRSKTRYPLRSCQRGASLGLGDVTTSAVVTLTPGYSAKRGRLVVTDVTEAHETASRAFHLGGTVRSATDRDGKAC